jgi:hypothetical protein
MMKATDTAKTKTAKTKRGPMMSHQASGSDTKIEATPKFFEQRWLPDRPPFTDEELARVDAFLRTLGVYLHPGQKAFVRQRAKNKILLCGRRWGKSFLIAVEMLLHIMEIVSLGWDYGRIMLTANSYKQIRESMSYLERMLARAGIPIRKVSTREERYYQAGPVKIDLRPLAYKKGLRGAGITMLIVDECSLVPAELFFYDLLPSVTDHKGRVLIAGTPSGRNWVIEFAEEQGIEIPYTDLNTFELLASPDGQTIIMRSPSWVNPHLDKKEIERQRALMPESAFRQEYGAEIIVETTDPFPHKPIVVDEPVSGPELMHAAWAAGIDYGFNEPSAIVLVAKLTNGIYYVPKVIYQANIPAEQFALFFKQQVPNYPTMRIGADPSFWNKDGRHQLADYFAAQHIPLIPGTWDRVGRWNMLRSILANNQLVLLGPECQPLMGEIESAKPKRTKPDDIEKPDHALSALTYAIEALQHEQPSIPIPPNSIYAYIQERLKAREDQLQGLQKRSVPKLPSRRW